MVGRETSESGRRSAHPERPRDASTLVIVDSSTGLARVLMGRRRADQVFLPGKFVFPGGRVDRADRRAPSADELRPGEVAKLLISMRDEPSPARARALALAAIRETFEETGLLVGTLAVLPARGASPAWKSFLAHGIVPRLAPLTFFARAITPPGRPRRYDTRFFCVEASAIAQRVEARDDELEALDWFTFAEMRSLDLPGITRVVIEDLAERLAGGPASSAELPVPFYFHRNGAFQRALLSQAATSP